MVEYHLPRVIAETESIDTEKKEKESEVAQSCPALCDPRLLHPQDSPGKNTGVGCISFSIGSS